MSGQPNPTRQQQPEGHRCSKFTPGSPRAPFCPDPEVPALVGVGCVSCAAGWGLPSTFSSSPRRLRLGSSGLLSPRFGQTSQNCLAWALLACQSPRSLLHLHPSLSFRADTPTSPPTPPPRACSPPPLASYSHLPRVAPDQQRTQHSQ